MIDSAILEKEAMQLPESDRALLAAHLLASLSRIPTTVSQAWLAEADSRLSAHRAGEIPAVDGPQAMPELRSRFVR